MQNVWKIYRLPFQPAAARSVKKPTRKPTKKPTRKPTKRAATGRRLLLDQAVGVVGRLPLSGLAAADAVASAAVFQLS